MDNEEFKLPSPRVRTSITKKTEEDEEGQELPASEFIDFMASMDGDTIKAKSLDEALESDSL